MLRFRFRPLLALCATAATLALVVSDADARPRSSFGSRGSQTYSAPPSTATSPTAKPIERTHDAAGPARRCRGAAPGDRTQRGADRRLVRPARLHGRPVRGLPRRRPARHDVRPRPHRRPRRLRLDARPDAADRHRRHHRLSVVDLVAAPQPAGASPAARRCATTRPATPVGRWDLAAAAALRHRPRALPAPTRSG